MPAESKAQRRAMAIAEHRPDELYGRNRGLLKMTQGQLHDFAGTKEKGLPSYAKASGGGPARKKKYGGNPFKT